MVAKTEAHGLIARRTTIPRPADGLVERRVLEERIARIIDTHSVVLVSATAGAGKTTAVAHAVALRTEPTAWLTLDDSDTDATRLLMYVEAALASVVPFVADLARHALAVGLAGDEAVGLLLEAVGETPVTLVLDELEHIQNAPNAWRLIESIIRYAPDAVRLVLIGRRPFQLHTRMPTNTTAQLGDEDLAFVEAEVAAMLDAAGNHDLEPQSVLALTGGWVTGVLFESVPASGAGRGPDPLHGYLATQILDDLDDLDRDFLVRCSVLDEITVEVADSIGLSAATAHFASLREKHLPVIWLGDGTRMRCHPRFRAFLLTRLTELPAADVAALRHRHGRLLLAQGRVEEAVEELFRAGAYEEASGPAGYVLPYLIDRLDLDVAERWLSQLDGPLSAPLAVVEAELMIAAGKEDYLRTTQIADLLHEVGRRDELIRRGGPAVALMAWAYSHLGRVDEVGVLLELAPEGPPARVMRYLLRMTDAGDVASAPDPGVVPGPLQALVLRGRYLFGQFDRSLEDSQSRWVTTLTLMSRIAALRSAGRTTEAARMLGAIDDLRAASVGLQAIVGPEVLLDADRPDEARELARQGLAAARRSGSSMFACWSLCVAAKIALRDGRDWRTALARLDELRGEAAGRYRNVFEIEGTWRGYALIEAQHDQEAYDTLVPAIASMQQTGRILELPTAGVYLAEAAWRLGLQNEADAAADLAREAALQQGSNHLLLQALSDFPAVLSRRLDAEPGTDSPWHALGRALASGCAGPASAPLRAQVEFKDLGEARLFVGGKRIRPRIAKTLELLAYLLTRSKHTATREELLDALFDGRDDDSSRSYLRQAVTWLRRVLPENAVETTRGSVGLCQTASIDCDSMAAQRALQEAGRLQGDRCVAAFEAASELLQRGELLEGCRSTWVAERREELNELADRVRFDAATAAFEAGALIKARDLLQKVLRRDPYREASWRLQMRLASAIGDEEAVLAAYGSCEAALTALGVATSQATRDLLVALRC